MTKNTNQAWWSRALLIGGVIGLVMLVVGPVGTKLGIWSFMPGIFMMLAAASLSAIVLVGGFIGVIFAQSKGRLADRNPAAIGSVLAVVVMVVVVFQMRQASQVPDIHDISTDLDNPPAFVAVLPLRKPDDNTVEYDPAVAEKQRNAYPDILPLTMRVSTDQAFAQAAAAARAMGWEIVTEDAAAGRIEATDTTFWFGFKDDVVIRVQPSFDGDGSRIDVRSISRVGVSDLGKNAARISAYFKQLAGG